MGFDNYDILIKRKIYFSLKNFRDSDVLYSNYQFCDILMVKFNSYKKCNDKKKKKFMRIKKEMYGIAQSSIWG